MYSSWEEVLDFLALMRELILKKRWRFEVERNQPTIDLLGVTNDDVRDTLLALEVTDYCRGPKPDDTFPGDVWFFKRNLIDSVVEIYIKMNITPQKHFITVISFHPPNLDIKHHFR